jgi:hypothetical protein
MSTLRVDNIKSRTGTVLTVPDGNTLAVTGIASVTGGVTNAGNFTNTGTLSVGGNATVTGILDVNGASNFNNPSGIITTGTLNVSTLSQQNGTFSGTVTAAAFSGPLTGTASAASSLAAGATGTDLTLSGDLTVNGTTTTIDTAVTAVDSLAIDGNISVGGTATFKGVTETTNVGAYAGSELTCDTATGTVFTHDLQDGLVNSIKISNFPATANSFHTVTVILTQNDAGTGHTTTALGIGTNVTLDPIGVTAFSKTVKVGLGQTITLGTTADDINIVTLGVHYNGGTNTDAANYNVFITKSGDFR